MTKQLIGLAQDMASFYDIPQERIEDDLRAALSGDYRRLQKYGVVIPANASTAECWHTVLRCTADAQGDLARAGE